MAKQEECKTEVWLLQRLLAIELWRGGLSQGEIAKRLSMGTIAVNEILKGVNRAVPTTTDREK